jgi:hypothetical protein
VAGRRKKTHQKLSNRWEAAPSGAKKPEKPSIKARILEKNTSKHSNQNRIEHSNGYTKSRGLSIDE